jgi:predicted DNA-binding transcriptional regulator
MKQSVEPQSIRVIIFLLESDKSVEERGIRRELGSERADALIRISSCAQRGVTQPSACAEVEGLPAIFLDLPSC